MNDDLSKIRRFVDLVLKFDTHLQYVGVGIF